MKNNASLRHIPLHDHLIELGFLEFVKGSNDWLFPDVPADKYGAKSTKFATWWGQVVREQGIDIHQPTHAFRHTFKTMLRTLGASDRVNDANIDGDSRRYVVQQLIRLPPPPHSLSLSLSLTHAHAVSLF